MKKTALILILLTVLTKMSGFCRDIVLSYFYGASYISDAYLISLTIPGTIFTFIEIGIVTSYIPIYSEIKRRNGTQSADRFTSNIINFILLGCTVITIFSFLFTTPIVKIFASGFKGETLDWAVIFTRIHVLGIYFYALIFIFKSYLQIRDKFIVPALTGIIPNLMIIISILLSIKLNIIILSIGTTLAIFIQLLCIIPFVYKQGYRYTCIMDRHDKWLKKMLYLSLPVILGGSVDQINLLVDRTIASQIVEGGISALTYANRLTLFVHGIFVLSIATVIYPMITKMATANNMAGLKNVVSEAINSILLLVMPATVGAMVFAEPIVKLLFGRGAFDAQAIAMTSYALFFYSIGMVGYGLREVLSKAFYSIQDTKTPMVNAALALVMNVILNIVLSKYLGIGGLALATSVSAIFCTILLFISFKKRIGVLSIKYLFFSFVKILIASIVMGIMAKSLYSFLINDISISVSLFLSIFFGAVVYTVIICFMNIDEVNKILLFIREKM